MMDQRVAKRLKDALDSMVYVPSVWQSETVGEGPPAKGQVWDRRELFARLQTFRAANWFAKPEGIKPEDCARKGWRNAGPDLLACEFCQGQIKAPIPPGAEPADIAFLADRYAKLLTSAHDASCPWHEAACPAELLGFPSAAAETLQNEWLRRTQLLQRVACLPPLSQEAAEELLPPGFPSSSPALASFLREHAGVDHGTDVVALATAGEPALHGSAAHRARAVLIALLGWTAEPLGGASGSGEGAEASPQYLLPERCLLRCALCGATVGLWSCFPELVRSADAGASSVASPRPAGAPAGARGVMSPTVTIAGGALAASARDGARTVQGPFGLRGRQSPSFGSPGQDRAGGEAAVRQGQSSVRATSLPQQQAPPCTIAGGRLDAEAGAGPRPAQSFKGSAAPFGFASLEAQMSRRGLHSAGVATCGKRAREEADGTSVKDLPVAAGPEVPVREPTTSPRLALPVAVDDASGWYLSSNALERYARLSVRPLDVVSLHRSFCPWTASGQGRPGWEQVLDQLAPEGAADARAASKECAPAQPTAAEWNPVTLLNSVLGKVDVQL